MSDESSLITDRNRHLNRQMIRSKCRADVMVKYGELRWHKDIINLSAYQGVERIPSGLHTKAKRTITQLGFHVDGIERSRPWTSVEVTQ